MLIVSRMVSPTLRTNIQSSAGYNSGCIAGHVSPCQSIPKKPGKTNKLLNF